MAAQAKYLFDQDFAAGDKAVAPSEHAIMLGEAESKGFRDGFAAAEKEGTAVAARRAAVAFEQIGDALDRLARGLAAVEQRLETEAVELAVAVARKLAPELVSARAVRRDRGARHRMLQAARRGAARRRARQRRAARDRPHAARRDRPHPRLRRPPGGARRARHRGRRLQDRMGRRRRRPRPRPRPTSPSATPSDATSARGRPPRCQQTELRENEP